MVRTCLVTHSVGAAVMQLVPTVTTEDTGGCGGPCSPKLQVETQSEDQEPDVALMAVVRLFSFHGTRPDMGPEDHTPASSSGAFCYNYNQQSCWGGDSLCVQCVALSSY